MSKHTVVWLDHQEARVIDVHPEAFDEATIRAPKAHLHRHAKGASEAKAHPQDAKQFFDEIARALESAHEVLVLGPGTAKLHFIKHVHQHQRALEPKIVGVETVDHPSDPQLVAYGKQYFLAADRMR